MTDADRIMIIGIPVSEDDLAEAICSAVEYEEIIKLFELVDDIQADSVFTDMVMAAFKKREEKLNRDRV